MPAFINYNLVDFSANIVVVIPMGIIASAYFKKARVGLVVGALGSCLIELAQGLLLPERFASGMDVLANTMSAGMGAVLYLLMTPILIRRAPTTAAHPLDLQRPKPAVTSGAP